MTAQELLKQGDLSGALAAVQTQIRSAPQDARLRVFLFQLLCVHGDWKRAIQQLKTCATLEPAAATMAQMYREAIICEVYREKVFAAEKTPLIFGEPQEWMAWMIEALKQQVQGDLETASALRARAFEAAPNTAGTLNGTAFDWIADADPQLGPLLEAIVDGKYFWVPFTALHRITIEAPADLRDTVWMPATVTWANGGDAVVLIPTRYAGTLRSSNATHRLARSTDWVTLGANVAHGVGQRLLITDTQDCALMDIREMVLGASPVDAVADHG